MSKKAFDAISEGLNDAISYAKGNRARGRATRVHVENVNVANTRKKLGLSQSEFASAFGVSPATIKNWEQGRRQPEGPARVLLNVIDREPEAVKRAISISSSAIQRRVAKAR